MNNSIKIQEPVVATNEWIGEISIRSTSLPDLHNNSDLLASGVEVRSPENEAEECMTSNLKPIKISRIIDDRYLSHNDQWFQGDMEEK